MSNAHDNITGPYIRFTEDNDWEGEVWRFYIPLEGNTDALYRWAELTKGSGGDDDLGAEANYHFDLNHVLTAETVKALVTLSGSTDYMAEHTVLAGTLAPPDETGTERLYKGGLCKPWSGLTVVATCPVSDGDEDDV